jgi:hypothetical protein
VAGCCEHGSGTSNSMKGGEFFDDLSACQPHGIQLLKYSHRVSLLLVDNQT